MQDRDSGGALLPVRMPLGMVGSLQGVDHDVTSCRSQEGPGRHLFAQVNRVWK